VVAHRAPARHFIETRGQCLDCARQPRKSRSPKLVGAYAPFANGGQGVLPACRDQDPHRRGQGPLRAAARPAGPGDRAAQRRDDEHHDAGDAAVRHRAQGGDFPVGWPPARPAPARISATPGSSATRRTWSPAVWLGNDDNSPTRKATGGGLPVEVWTRFMRAAHQGVPVAGLPASLAGGFFSTIAQAASTSEHAPGHRTHPRKHRRQNGADAHVSAAGSSSGPGRLADGTAVRSVDPGLSTLYETPWPLSGAGTRSASRQLRGCSNCSSSRWRDFEGPVCKQARLVRLSWAAMQPLGFRDLSLQAGDGPFAFSPPEPAISPILNRAISRGLQGVHGSS